MAFYPKNSKLLQFHSKLFEVDKVYVQQYRKLYHEQWLGN